MKFRLPRRIKYLRKARHWRGHGIHSPFLFYLITKVIEDRKQYSAYRILRYQKKQILSKIKEAENPDELICSGCPLQNQSGKKRLFKNVELGYRYGKLLFRLIREFKPSSVCFYGPTLGMNLLYLALADENSPVTSVAFDSRLNKFCLEILKSIPCNNVSFQLEESIRLINQDFVFVNLPFSPDESKRIIQLKMKSSGEDDVVIIRGIHKSEAMESLWKEVIKDRRIRVSLDLYEIGILLFRRKLQKQHFVLRF